MFIHLLGLRKTGVVTKVDDLTAISSRELVAVPDIGSRRPRFIRVCGWGRWLGPSGGVGGLSGGVGGGG